MNTKVAKKNNKGFTLIELIVVIAIIAVLAAILAPQYLRYVEKSRLSADVSTAKEIMNAVQTACADETAYSSIQNGTTVTWTSDKNKGALTVAKATGTGFEDELKATFGDLKNLSSMKSKVWQNAYVTKKKGWVITIHQDDKTMTVNLTTDPILS